jgi:hypothetical protein
MSRPTPEQYVAFLEAELAEVSLERDTFAEILQGINDWIISGGHDLSELTEIMDRRGGK